MNRLHIFFCYGMESLTLCVKPFSKFSNSILLKPKVMFRAMTLTLHQEYILLSLIRLFHCNLVVVEWTSPFFFVCVLQLLNVYEAKYETGGKFWPIVHSSTIFSLVLMHIIAIGLFGLKKLPLASSLTIPLPVLTLLFNIYCQRRFLPNFKSYPTEVNAL